ncbi:hypothetical protein SAPIO_CDS6652 [Scedosporium apiospermum]|uniref:Uncharacterized protein n=1 Tax=Pseudallescheria apiosperma TaxID=563466 RepID=A0A084G3D4_PSEDA|nr:uncharacterized protein SAPIO_CDS6652 [Scedosporium apiospermum]KEZ41846.1 hypothetical protein SAPIO_CDS6652 [Scedosporium apiospermum]
MSFGFGGSNVITLLERANKLRDRFADAPRQLRAVSSEVSSLASVLANIKDLLPQHDLPEWQKKALVPILDECDNVVLDVGKMVDENACLDPSSSKSSADKARRAWKRLTWDPKDVQQLRLRMASNVTFLNAFLGSLTRKVAVATKDTVDGLHTRQDVRERREQYAQILDWLASTDYTFQQHDHLRRQQPGTGQWLLNSSMVRTWLGTPGKTLFCPGIPGAGKTILTSIVVGHLLDKYQENPTVGIAYVYCNFRQQDEQRLDDLLSNILKQLSSPLMPDALEALYDKHNPKRTRPFLLAQLYIDSLVGKKSPRAVRVALQKLQRGVEAYDHAYHEAMSRVEGRLGDQEELAKQALSWIVFEKRPLSTRELQHALATELGDSHLREDNLPELEDVVSVCAGLVAVDEESGIIRLVHYTTQEYFQRTHEHWFPTAEQYITTICVTYLSFRSFESGPCQAPYSFEERLQLSHLYEYAASHWGHHASDALSTTQEVDGTNEEKAPNFPERTAKFDEAYRAVMDFLGRKANLEAAIQALFAPKVSRGLPLYRNDYPKQMTAHHLAAYFGLGLVAKGLLASDKVRLDARDSRGRTPLYLAVDKGHEAIVRQLLDTGRVDPNIRSDTGWAPLSRAAFNNHEAIVRHLPSTSEADLDIKDGCGRTVLHQAIVRGNEAIAQLFLAPHLLDTGRVNPDAKSVYGRTPLHAAAYNGREAMVRRLLETGKVDPDVKNLGGATPLHDAATIGDVAIIRHLLDAGKVGLNAEDCRGQTPLDVASKNGHEAVVRQLLATGKAK